MVSKRKPAAGPWRCEIHDPCYSNREGARCALTIGHHGFCRFDYPVPEKIVAAAIRQDGVVFTGAHHHQIIRYVVSCMGIPTVRGEQGFVTSRNRFVGREEAGEIAIAAGQVAALKFSQRDLFSEELWEVPDAAPEATA